MKKNFLLVLIAISMMSIGLVSAVGNFKILNSTDDIVFIVDNTGNLNVTGGWIAEDGVKLSEAYLALTGGTLTGILSSDSNITTTAYFVGDGSYLTNVPASMDYTNLALTNISETFDENLTVSKDLIVTQSVYLSDILECNADDQKLETDANGVLVCGTAVDTDTKMGTSGIYLYNDTTTIYFNETQLNATIDDRAGSFDYTNLAWVNETNTFTEEQTFLSNIVLGTSGVFTGNDTTTQAYFSDDDFIIKLAG